MSDIVASLRYWNPVTFPLVAQAADEIERLRAKNAAAESERDALIAALQSIASNTCCDSCNEAALVARAALERKP